MPLVIGGNGFGVGQSYLDEQERQRQAAARDRAQALSEASFDESVRARKQSRADAFAQQGASSSLQSGALAGREHDEQFADMRSQENGAANRAQALLVHQDDVGQRKAALEQQGLQQGIANKHADEVLKQNAADRAAALAAQQDWRGNALQQQAELKARTQAEDERRHQANEEIRRKSIIDKAALDARKPFERQAALMRSPAYAGAEGAEEAALELEAQADAAEAKIRGAAPSSATPEAEPASPFFNDKPGPVQPPPAPSADAPAAWSPPTGPSEEPASRAFNGFRPPTFEPEAPPQEEFPFKEWQPEVAEMPAAPEQPMEALPGPQPAPTSRAGKVIAAARAKREADKKAQQEEIQRVHKANADAAAERLAMAKEAAEEKRKKAAREALEDPYTDLQNEMSQATPEEHDAKLAALEAVARGKLPLNARDNPFLQKQLAEADAYIAKKRKENDADPFFKTAIGEEWWLKNNRRLPHELEAIRRYKAERRQGTAPAQPAAASADDIPKIASDAEFKALKSGQKFIGPDGVKRVKP